MGIQRKYALLLLQLFNLAGLYLLFQPVDLFGIAGARFFHCFDGLLPGFDGFVDFAEAQITVSEVFEDDAVDGNVTVEGATPMDERVAVLGFLNKRNGLTRDLEMRPGQAVRIGDDVIVRLRACEVTPPWEPTQWTGAFVQVDVKPRRSNDFVRIFSGWLYKESPSINVVEHQVYDVWVKSCAMSFPEGAAAPPRRGGSSSASSAANDGLGNDVSDDSAEPAAPAPSDSASDSSD